MAPAADAGTGAGRENKARPGAAAEPVADGGATAGELAGEPAGEPAAAETATAAAEPYAGRAGQAAGVPAPSRAGKRPGTGPRRGGGPVARGPGKQRTPTRQPDAQTGAPTDSGQAPAPDWLGAAESRIEVEPDARAAAEPAGDEDAAADEHQPAADGDAAAGATAEAEAPSAADTTAAAADEAGRVPDGGRRQQAAAGPAKPTYQPPEVVAKRRIAGRDPVYPPLARQAKLRATLMVKIYIEPDGTVGYTKFLKTHEVFEQAVREAIATWRFAPHRINDRPVGTYTVYKFVFQIDD